MEKNENNSLMEKAEKFFQEEKTILEYLKTLSTKYSILVQEDYEDHFSQLAELNAELEILCLVNNKTHDEMNKYVINFLLENEELMKSLLLIYPIYMFPEFQRQYENFNFKEKISNMINMIANFSNCIHSFLYEEYAEKIDNIGFLMKNEKEIFYKRTFDVNSIINLGFITLSFENFYKDNLFMGMAILKQINERESKQNIFSKLFLGQKQEISLKELKESFVKEIPNNIRNVFYKNQYEKMLNVMLEFSLEGEKYARNNIDDRDFISETIGVFENCKTITEGIEMLLIKEKNENSTLQKEVVNSKMFQKILNIFDNEGR